MSLTKYKQKRSFDKTPEPIGGTPEGEKLRFVVQKHQASHLHYDFRLELKGVLKSWAVPKGLSMNPGESRLAMLVEDHPWDYRNFEGIIPSGYGAGTVIVWDEGTYSTTEIKEKDKKAQEHSISSQFWKGHISFTLKGHKLKGDFTIGKAKDKDDNRWYIHKVKDKYSTSKDVTLNDKSVQSNRTLEQVALNPFNEWKSHKPAVSAEIKKPTQILKGKKSAFPTTLNPMLCTLIKEPFNSNEWLYEVKWDGYRIIAFMHNGSVILKSRGNLDYTQKYQALTNALMDLNLDAVIDGELVVLDDNGQPDFSALQNYKPGNTIAYYVFDMVWHNGYNIMDLSLAARKQLLHDSIAFNDVIRFSDSFDDGIELFNTAKKLGIEGIVAKKKQSIYLPGKKGDTWYKVKFSLRKEYVIGGWTESDNGRAFRSLIFGHYINGKLTYVQHSGGGYTDKQLKILSQKLKKLETTESPFVNNVDTKAKKHWVKPLLVGEFEQSGKSTSGGKIRHPAIFIGLRSDKKPEEVVQEVPKEIKNISDDNTTKPVTSKESPVPAAKSTKTEQEGSWEKLDKRKIVSENELKVEGETITLVNIERELWTGFTKAQLIQYYISVADYLLPHIKDRPLGLNICLNNAAQGGFFIRGMEGRSPSFATTFTTNRKHRAKGKSETIEWMVCNNLATLVYIINLETVDLHQWASRTASPQNPDYIVIDLDPSDNDFKKVITTALAAKKIFDKKKLKTFVKTSGKTGIHILIPSIDIPFGDSRTIAENICKDIHAEVPDITTTNVSLQSRGNLLYIDPNQNDYADRIAATYCVRAYHIPTVSTPLDWKEIDESLTPGEFTVFNITERLRRKGDLFKGIFDTKMRKKNSSILKKYLDATYIE